MSNQGTPPTPPSSIQTLANRGIQPRFGELAQSCRKLVMNRLAEHLTGVFAQVDDTLFECAEKAENNQVQTLFFDNMREIRKQRPQIERSYHKQIAQNLADFLDGKLKLLSSASELDVEHMALVQNEEYEESLRVTNMVSRVKARCAQPLFALEQRLALLNNGQKLGEDSNPFGPQMIAQAFRDALAPCPFPLRIKVILYTLFDTHVMQSLDSLYSALNQRLIEAGVLPNLKYSAQRNSQPARQKTAPTAAAAEQPAESNASSSRNTRAGSGAGQQPRAGNTDLSGPPPSDPMELLGNLATLLSEHRQRDIDAPCSAAPAALPALLPAKRPAPPALPRCWMHSIACSSTRPATCHSACITHSQ